MHLHEGQKHPYLSMKDRRMITQRIKKSNPKSLGFRPKRRALKFLIRLLLVLILLPLATVAKSEDAYTVDEIFQNFRKAYKKSRNFSAKFEETILQANTKRVNQGRLYFSKPNLLRKEYVSQKNPDEVLQLILLDGEYSWSYTPIVNQVNKMKWSKSDRKELLPGIGASLEDVQKNYNMKLVRDDAAKKKGIYQIELTHKPDKLSKPVNDTPPPRETLAIWIKTDEWLPVQFGYKFEDDAGNRESYITSLTNIKRNQDLDSTLFKFTVPEGVEIVDLTPDE